MNQLNSFKIKPNEKFGYSIETFQLSALASMSSQNFNNVKVSRNKADLTNQRIFGSYNEYANLNFGNVINKISLDYCYINNPNCNKCPINIICNNSSTIKLKQIKKKTHTKIFNFIDLFCGAGGMSSGLIESGMTPIMAIDNDPSSIKTYTYNHRLFNNLDIVCKEIKKNENLDYFFKLKNKIDLIVGGPPCQGFSNANRQRLSDDPRNYLYKQFLSILNISKSKFAILENVTGMKKASPSIAKEFEEIGYITKFFILNSSNFGLPQNRKRLFILAKQKEDLFKDELFFKYFEASLEKFKNKEKNYFINFLNNFPLLKAKNIPNSTDIESIDYGFSCWVENNEKSKIIFNHRSKYLNARDIEIYTLLKPGEDSSSKSIEHINPYNDRKHIFKDKFYKLHPDKPSKTITAHMYYDTHMYIHPFQARGLSPREAARVQGFKDDFVFFGYPNEWYRQIGNAVSPPTAKALGKALNHAIEKINEKN